jgi:hypothetical protein
MKFIDEFEEPRNEMPTGSGSLVFEPKEVPKFDHFFGERAQGRVSG